MSTIINIRSITKRKRHQKSQGMTNYRIGPHRTTSDHVWQCRQTTYRVPWVPMHP